MAKDDVTDFTPKQTETRVSAEASGVTSGSASGIEKLDEWLAESKWDLIERYVTDLLERELLSICDAAEFHLRRGEALQKMKRPAEALRDLEIAWETLKQRPEVARLLLRVMRDLRQYQKSLDTVDEALQIHPNSIDLLLAKADSFRLLGRQEEALDLLDFIEPDPRNTTLIRLKSSLLCDIGDFDSAIDCLLPATTPLEGADYVLLAARGWAHQNSDAPGSALLAEEVYRHALSVQEDDNWSRKGLANALRRLNRMDEARVEYQKVVDYAEKLRSRNALSPYDYCLAGWCYYCIDRFRDGADCSSAGLSALEIGAAAEFDYGLFMLADMAFDAATEQYERSILNLQSKNYLRRCGLLSIALTDLRDARQRHMTLAAAPETYAIETLLAKELEKALQDFKPGQRESLQKKIQRHIDDVHRDAQSAEAQLSAMMSGRIEDVRWGGLQVVGFQAESAIGPCALLAPAISHIELPGKLYSLDVQAGSRSLTPIPVNSRASASGRGVVHFTRKYPASAGATILWISNEMLDALGSETFETERSTEDWERLAKPVPSWAQVTSRGAAKKRLDRWAEQLIARCVETLIRDFQGAEDHSASGSLRLAALALAAAQSKGVWDRAFLVYSAVGGSWRSYKSVEHQLPASDPQTGAAFEREVQEFQRKIKLRAEISREGHGDDIPSSRSSAPLEAVALPPAEQERKNILDRARAIGEVSDQGERDRLAAEAASEMQMLVPLTAELEPVREKLVESLNTQEKVHLDSHESILLMSRTPGFYASSVLVGSNRPLIHSLTFLRETRRMLKSGMTIPDDTLYITDHTRTRGGS